MKNKTLVLLSTFLAVIVLLFHLSAKKQPSDDGNTAFNSMDQPRKWQGKPAPDFSADFLNGERFALSEHIGGKVIILNL